jgi:rhamnulokinase
MDVRVAAIDLGASSGRVMVGEVSPDQLTLRRVVRFPNNPVRLPDGLRWNILELFRNAVEGLAVAVREGGANELVSVAVDSWAVDYGLIRGGQLLGVPFHYRDERCARGVEAVHSTIGAEVLYERNGLQFLPFNTLYQLAVDRLLDFADHALLVPDLIGYWLTGRLATERTNASTTGLLDVRTQDWDRDLAAQLGLRDGLFPPLVDAGTPRGPLLPAVADLVGAPHLQVAAVGSHDTASAVVGVPLTGDDAAYISCGTWGLVGVELDKPVLTAASRSANFTNEAGVDGRNRFLTNVMGTWLLSETVRAWERTGGAVELGDLLDEAAQITGPVAVFDVQDPRLLPPGDMPRRIRDLCIEGGLPVPDNPPAMVRTIVHSLASGYARAVDQAAGLSGRTIRTVHIVGGGAQNALLCQAIADYCNRRVIAGPVEATALGNVLVQARSLGAISGGLEELRELIVRTHALTVYTPRDRIFW